MFHQIPFSDDKAVSARLIALLQIAGYQAQQKPDYIRWQPNNNFIWADQITIFLRNPKPSQSSKEFIEFHCYAGNTQNQGEELFKHSQDWTKKNVLSIEFANNQGVLYNVSYSLEIFHHIKFCLFRGEYETAINCQTSDFVKNLYTLNNFHQLSGQKKADTWLELEIAFDNHFNPSFDWRNNFQGETKTWDNLKKSATNRGYFNMNFGYGAVILIPYTQFQHLDAQNPTAAPDFLKAIEKAFSTLIP